MMVSVITCGAIGDGVTDDVVAINQCLQDNDEVVINNGIFLIGSSIIVPSNTALYLKNCEILLADNSYDNLIRNENQTGDSNIKIIGLGNATLNQNAVNNDDGRATYGKSQVNSWHYLGVFLCNVTNFELSGFTLRDYTAWGILIQRCSGTESNKSIVKDIWFDVLTSLGNQDGIDIGHGSHDVEVSNIQGTTGDDFIAVLSYDAGDFVNRDYMNGDTYNLSFNELLPNKAGINYIRFLAGDGGTIKDITGSEWDSRYIGAWAIVVGADTFPTTPPTNADINNIVLDGFIVNDLNFTDVINLSSPCSDIYITNLVNNSGKNLITTNRTPTDIWVNGTQYY